MEFAGRLDAGEYAGFGHGLIIVQGFLQNKSDGPQGASRLNGEEFKRAFQDQ